MVRLADIGPGRSERVEHDRHVLRRLSQRPHAIAARLLLDQFDAARIPERLDVWSRAYRQLLAGTMPPVGAPRPDRATYDAVMVSVEQALGAHVKPTQADSPEIAARLATLLWNSAPDAALLHEARANRLIDPAVLEREVRRMLASIT